MKLRIGLRLGGLSAAIACAALVACGGGGSSGGGGTSVIPVSSPATTPTPTIAPTSQSTSGPLSTSATTAFAFGSVSSGGVTTISSATLTLPAVNVASNATATLSATLPTGVPAPAARSVKLRKPDTLGVPSTGLAYFAVTFSSNVTLSSNPGISITFPSAVSGNCYIVVYDTSQALGPGWLEVSGPVTGSGATLTFPPAVISPAVPLKANVVYVFAVITTSSVIPTPTPTIAPTATPSSTATPSLAPTIAPTTNANGWSASQVANQFQFPVQSGYNGAGQTIVVLGDYSPNQSDLSAYLSYYGITSTGATYTTVPINGFVAPGTDTSGLGEATLDMETVLSLAPGAKVEYYAMPDLTGTSFVDAYTQLSNDTNATVMTASFGGCEGAGFTDTTEHPLLAQAAAHGIIMFASSGDQGNECYVGPGYSPGANAPASDPDVVGVGGQENFTTGTSCPGTVGGPSLTTQAVWNDCFFSSGQGASGGGVSTLFTPPPYQSGFGTSATFRNVPDISMPAEGIAIYLSGAWQTYGGTSWGAPAAAAMTADINQYCGGTMNVPGTDPVARFYTAFTRSNANFLDITSGTNQFGTSTPFYSAATGYDNASGLGIPYGMLVAASLCPGHVAQVHPMSVTHSTQAVAVDSYGQARDTALRYVPRIANDMGSRGSSSVNVALVMRATPTLAADEQTVVAALQNAGFTITRTYANHLTIDASAPASTAERFFQTNIHNTMQAQYGERYANTSPIVLPAAIAPYVHGVVADNLVRARWFHHRLVPVDRLTQLMTTF